MRALERDREGCGKGGERELPENWCLEEQQWTYHREEHQMRQIDDDHFVYVPISIVSILFSFLSLQSPHALLSNKRSWHWSGSFKYFAP